MGCRIFNKYLEVGMNKLKGLVCLMVLVGSISAYYDYPCRPAFLSSCRPFSFENSPTSLFLSQERAAFAFEIAAGEYALSLFPWPSIQGYWHFVYKNLGGSVALINNYQYTARHAVNWAKGYFWDTQLIYTLRSGLSYQLFPFFIFGLSGDINYGFSRFDFSTASDSNDWIPDTLRHKQSSDLSFSFSLGSAISSRTKYKIFEMLYQSEVNAFLSEGLYFQGVRYMIPAQLSVSLNYPIGAIDVHMKYCHRWGKYRDFYDSLQTINTHDFMVDFLIPVDGNTKFYLGCYTIPYSYTSPTKGFGIGLGPQLSKATFLKEILIFNETGEGYLHNTSVIWRLTRYGIRLGFVW